MGNSSSSGRKLSPFSQKMAEGVFPAKVCHPRTATTPPRLPPPPIDTATAPLRDAVHCASVRHRLLPTPAAAGRRAVRCDLDGDVL